MPFEILPNELVYTIFEFFDSTDLFRGFYGLNTRLNKLVLTQRKYYFNFQHTAREEFDYLCVNQLSSIGDRVISIEIHDDIETPNFSVFFLQYVLQFYYFPQLKSLTLCSIDSHYLLISIIKKCGLLPNFTHLNIIERKYVDTWGNISVLYNYIWSLPRLTHCNLCGIPALPANRIYISTVSSTITNVIVADQVLNTFFHILNCTPNLQRLEVINQEVGQYVIGIPDTFFVTSLRISFSGDKSYLKHIFQCLPELHHLTIEISQIVWDGHGWEHVVNKYLPKLRLLRFKMEECIMTKYNSIDYLLKSFQTSFWLHERRWYVGCYWNPHNIYRIGIIHTLPYVFNSLDIHNDWSFKTTAPENINLFLYQQVREVTYSGDENCDHKVFFDCSNIRKLYINFPREFNSFSWFSSLNRLKSLYIFIQHELDYDRLQYLLDQLPCLYSLSLDIQGTLSDKIFQLTCSSIRRLDFPLSNYSPGFTMENCDSLILSPLGRQCEVFSLQIDSPFSILKLIQYIPQLRSLCYQWKLKVQSSEILNVQLINILDIYLPSVCSFSDRTKYSFQIEIWINRQLKNFILSSLAIS